MRWAVLGFGIVAILVWLGSAARVFEFLPQGRALEVALQEIDEAVAAGRWGQASRAAVLGRRSWQDLRPWAYVLDRRETVGRIDHALAMLQTILQSHDRIRAREALLEVRLLWDDLNRL